MSLIDCLKKIAMPRDVVAEVKKAAKEFQAKGDTKDIAERKAAKTVLAHYDGMAEDLRATLVKKGYDLSPKGIEVPKNQTFYQSGNQGFYSGVERAASALKQEKGSGDQMLAAIQNTPGVKAEEIEWTGLDTFLKGKKSVTKKEVQDYIAANRVEVKDVTIEDKKSTLFISQEQKKGITEYNIVNEDGSVHESGFRTMDAAQKALEEAGGAGSRTKYSQHTLPGGDNYREVLLTLPPTEAGKFDPSKVTLERKRRSATQGSVTISYDGKKLETYEDAFEINPSTGQYEGQTDERWIESAKRLFEKGSFDQSVKPISGDFRSQHFDQANILAHVRLNDRVDADGKKVLFVEEIQSDWHQKGRKHGYKLDPERAQELEARRKELETMGGKLRDEGKEIPDSVRKEWADIMNELQPENTKRVPDAPLKKTWHETAMRRVLQMAAEGGYDRVAWTTGEQQAERFDLSKQVEKVRYYPKEKSLLIWEKGQNGDRASINKTDMDWKDLPDVIGKEAADKLAEKEKDSPSKFHDLNNLDLKVGGEGMKGFYDKILPDYARKFGKKFGATVGEAEIPTGITHPKSKIGPSFKVHSIDITPDMRDSVKQGVSLFQGGKDGIGPRGSITFTPEGGAIIHTFAKEDLSTVLHEFGHLYWKAMTEIGNLTDAPPSVVRDIKTMRDWVGAKEGEVLTVEQEEKIADGFLDYLRKGEAPSADMQGAFSRFKSWLVRIYSENRDTLPKISPEVKDVFDRMFATDAEIEAVRNTPEFQPDPSIMAMLTKADRERYQVKMEKQIVEAKDRLFREAMRQSERTQTQLYKDQRAEIEKVATEQISSAREYRTIEEIIKAGGINRKKIVKLWGEEAVSHLTKKGFKIAGGDGGADPELMAGLMGYGNSTEMRDDLMNLMPRREAIRKLTDDEMVARHGDMLHDGTIEGEALKAYQNNLKAELIHMEMETAAKAAGIPAPSKEAIKARSISMLSDMEVGKINSHRFYMAELKAAREAGLAAGKKDYAKAAAAKGRQLLNHHLYRLALDAREHIDSQIERWSKNIIYKKDKTIDVKTNDINYVNAARYILSRHGLGSKRLDEAWFKNWLAQLNYENPETGEPGPYADKEAYEAIQAAISVENNLPATPYKNMVFSEFLALGDAVNGISLIGKDRAKFTANGKSEDIKAVKSQIANQLANHEKSGISTGFSGRKTNKDKIKTLYLSAEANMRRVEHWAQMMDLGNAGPFHDYIFMPMKRASLAYRDENNIMQKRVYDLLKPHEDRLHGDKIPAPELLNERQDAQGKHLPGYGETYTFDDLGHLIGMLAHLGNGSNRTKLLRGYGWSEENMQRFLDRMYADGTLKKEDIDLVQSMWQITKELKPRLWAAHKKMFGFYPDSVTTEPFKTPFGEYEGGYWPAKADKLLSPDAARRADEQVLNDHNNSFAFPTTGRGALKARDESYAAPLEMRINLLANHLDWALRFIHIEPVAKDVAKVVMSRDFRAEMDKIDPTVTSEMLVPWLNRTTKQITEIPSMGSEIGKFLGGLARTLQVNAGIQALGGNMANVFIHTTALAEFTHALGVETDAGKAAAAMRVAESTAKFLASPIEMTRAQDEMSAELRTRGQVGELSSKTKLRRLLKDQSTNETIRTLEGLSAVRAVRTVGQASHDNAYILQSIIWHTTDRIGWDAAYNMALDGDVKGVPKDDHSKAVEYADSTVRRIQGSHNPEDIANVQMRSAIAKMFTFLHGWYNTQKNYNDAAKYLIKMSGNGIVERSSDRFYLMIMTALMVGAGGGMISSAMRGATPMQSDKDKREGTVAVNLAKDIAIDMVRYKAGQYAFAGQVVNGIINTATGQNYSDTIAPSPVLDQVLAVPRTVKEVYHMAHGKGHDETAVGDLLSSLGMVTGLPLSAAKKPVKYLIKVKQNREHPKNALEFTRGILGGSAPKK